MVGRKIDINWYERVVHVALPACAFFGGMALNAYTIAEKIASKPYVDEKFTQAIRYTDERTAQTLKDAFEHSDKNRLEMLNQFEKNNATMQGLEVKVDLLRSSVDALYKEALIAGRRSPIK